MNEWIDITRRNGYIEEKGKRDPPVSCKNWARGERTRVTPVFWPCKHWHWFTLIPCRMFGYTSTRLHLYTDEVESERSFGNENYPWRNPSLRIIGWRCILLGLCTCSELVGWVLPAGGGSSGGCSCCTYIQHNKQHRRQTQVKSPSYDVQQRRKGEATVLDA